MIDVKLIVDPQTGHMLLARKETGEAIGMQTRVQTDDACGDAASVTVTFVFPGRFRDTTERGEQ